MQKIKYRWNKEYLMVVAVLIFIAIMFIGARPVVINHNDMIVYDEELIVFNNEWVYSISGSDGIRRDIVNLPGYINIDKNNIISIENELPPVVTDGTYLSFRTENNFVWVYIDEVLVYESSTILHRNNETQPLSLWNFVHLSQDNGGAHVKIILQSPYPSYSGVLPNVIMGTHAEALLYASAYTAINQQLSLSTIIIGILIFLFGLISLGVDETANRLVYLAIGIAIMGLMMLADNGIPRNDSQAYYVDYLIVQICLRIAPLMLSFYYLSFSANRGKGIWKIIFWICCFVFVLSIMADRIMFLDFIVTEVASNLMILLIFSVGCYYELYSKKSASSYYKLLVFTAYLIFTVCFFLDRFTQLPYVIQLPFDLSCLGITVFSLLQMVAVLLFTYERVMAQVLIQKGYNESKIKLMISQIQPHFICNSLSTIRVMIKCDPDKAYKMICDFSNYLTYNLNSLEEVSIVPFSEELKHIKAYVDIEKERFFDRLAVQYEIKSENFVVPPLSVQPFIENAIKHGVCKKTEGGYVDIKSFSRGNDNIITISDNGVGFDVDAIKNQRGIGIENASFRLEKLVSATIQIESKKSKGTVVTIILPKNRKGVEYENDIG